MKKTLIIAVLLVATMSANAQWFDFSNNNHRYETGINLGVTGIGTGYQDFGFGVSLEAWGVYLDFTTAGPMYEHDNRVASMNDPANVRYIPDSTTTTVNLGYQIPVLPWLRVMPIFGITINTSGYTDMATQNISVSGNSESVSAELYHDYKKQHTWSDFNYGGGLVISPIKWVSIYGVYTTHAIYGGITFNFSPLRNTIDIE